MSATNEEHGVPGRPLVFGEVVIDELGNGEHRPGGAPLNVAWHLRGFGLDPLLLSRVGADVPGGLLLERLRASGLDTRGVQVDASRPTGRVSVATVDAEPRFTIPDDQAYDHIESAALPPVSGERLAFLYHGTLAVRHATSAATLRGLRSLRLPTFVDVNLRAPWWERGAVEDLLAGARWLKLNAAELTDLDGAAGTLLQRADRLRKHFGLDTVVVTSGGQGSLAVTAELSYQERPDRIANFVDSVGAGDAFCAVLLLGVARGWALPLALRRATMFAAAICGVRGALPPDDSLYQRFSRQWRT